MADKDNTDKEATKVKPTSATAVKSLLKQGKKNDHSVGNGLYLKVSGKGTGSWYFRYKVANPAKDKINKDNEKVKGYNVKRIGLGAADVVTLADAKNQAHEQRLLLSKGIDPQEHRAKLNAKRITETITFDMVAADYIAANRDHWKNAKHAQQWTNTLATYASPVIGHLPPSKITTEHIVQILQPIWSTKAETARRIRNRLEAILDAAKARKLREGDNVATLKGNLEPILGKQAKIDRRNQSALHWAKVSEFYTALKGDKNAGAQALQLTILTGLRTSEVLGAHWSEFDLDAGEWTIPAKRMKAKKEHRVPLSPAALDLLKTIPKVESGLLFEGQKQGKTVSNMAMLMKIRRMDTDKHSKDGIGWRDKDGHTITVHGFRSTFRDWAAENTTTDNIVVEQALAHTIGNAVEAAYRRGDLLERRRKLMELWAEYVTRKTASNVINIKQEA